MTLAVEGLARRRFSVDEVMEMVEAGILPEDEPVELLRGELIVVSPQGIPHRALTIRLHNRFVAAYGERAHVQDHSSLVAGDDSMPEPDVAVVRGSEEEFWERLPRTAETIVVVEIANTSRLLDRAKAALYAEGGVPVYWLIDLPRRSVTVHEDPAPEGYRHIRVLGESDEIAVPETKLVWCVRDILPPR